MPRKRLNESIRSVATASRFNLVKVLSYHFNSVLSHAQITVEADRQILRAQRACGDIHSASAQRACQASFRSAARPLALLCLCLR